MMKGRMLSLLALGLALGTTLQARADLTTFTITDVGTFTSNIDTNTNDTFSGTGFVGIYPTSNFPISPPPAAPPSFTCLA